MTKEEVLKKLQMKQFPIQIIEEDVTKGGSPNFRWIALTKDIDYTENKYHNVYAYHPGVTKLDEIFFERLFLGGLRCNIAPWDVIRNPTMEEMIEISMAAKKLGIKINLKTIQCTGI